MSLYSSSGRQPDMCGPGERFTSSQTDVNGDINNSSLSVDSITVDLNGTLVECRDVNNDLIDSDNICIVGKINSTITVCNGNENYQLDPYNFIFNVMGWCNLITWLLRTAYNY